MVTIINYAVSVNTETGEKFISLVLEGDIEFVKSQQTGRLYATARRTKIPSTFDEERSATLIGKELPGNIIKVPCEPYEYTVPETGEVIELSHTYEYTNEEHTGKQIPVAPGKTSKQVDVKTDTFSKNGVHELIA